MTSWRGFAALVGAMTLVWSSASAQTFPHAELGRQMLENHIRPTYRNLEAAIVRLRSDVQDACVDGAANSDELGFVERSYRNAVLLSLIHI